MVRLLPFFTALRVTRNTRSRTPRLARRAPALEGPGSNSVSRQAAVLHRAWSVPLIHFGRRYDVAARASLNPPCTSRNFATVSRARRCHFCCASHQRSLLFVIWRKPRLSGVCNLIVAHTREVRQLAFCNSARASRKFDWASPASDAPNISE